MPMKERLESTTSYFSDEDEGVREFAYGKIRNEGLDCEGDEGLYDETESFNHPLDTPVRNMHWSMIKKDAINRKYNYINLKC